MIAATTGITYATTAGSTATGVVYACANSKGTLRLLTASGTCAKGFHKVAINQRGPAGPAGPGAGSIAVESTSSGWSPKPTACRE